MGAFFYFYCVHTFLEDVTEKLVAELSDVNTTLIVPGFRAKALLQKQLIQKLQQPTLNLSVLTLQEFIQLYSGIQPVDRYAAAVHLFKIYQQSKSYNNEQFEAFYPKALTLISDFNFIDSNLKDTHEFFNYLSAEKSLSRWQLEQQKPDDIVSSYINFWNEIPQLYTNFKKVLWSKNLGYSAMLYERAEQNFPNHPKQQFYFIGFNASSQIELKLLQKLKAQHEVRFFYDVDRFLLQQKHYSLQAILNNTKALSIPKEKMEMVSEHFSNEKTFNVQGFSNTISLAEAICNRIVELTNAEVALHKIAVVLGDESLLMPIIEQLPQTIQFNAGIGLKFVQTTLYAEIKQLLKTLVKHADTNNFDEDILKDFNQNHLKLDELKLILKKLKDQNRSLTELEAYLETIKSVKNALAVKSPDIPRLHSVSLNLCREVLDETIQNFSEFPETFTPSLFLQRFCEVSGQKSFFIKGSPEEGIQLLGLLETRAIDFEHLIFAPFNEGYFPAQTSAKSFITFDTKLYFKLPTPSDQEQLMAYHFYRLLYRASAADFFYISAADSSTGVSTAEVSRFVKELQFLNHNKHKFQTLPNYKTGSTEIKKPNFIKTPEVQERLKAWAAGGISATALTAYIANPAYFYKKYILNVQEVDPNEELFSDRKSGSIIHNALEFSFKKHIGKVLKYTDLKQAAFEKYLYESLESEQVDVEKLNGKDLLNYHKACWYYDAVLEIDRTHLSRNKTLKILEVEQQIEVDFTQVHTTNVKLKGKIDRVDQLDGQLRIVDYKIAKSKPNSITEESLESAFNNENKSRAFQLLFYSYLYYKTTGKSMHAVNYYAMPDSKYNYEQKLRIAKNEELNSVVFSTFENRLTQLIEEILNPEIAFYHKSSRYYEV